MLAISQDNVVVAKIQNTLDLNAAKTDRSKQTSFIVQYFAHHIILTKRTMNITFDFINGLCFGIEYVGKNLDEDIDESVVIIEFACFRAIVWTGDFE